MSGVEIERVLHAAGVDERLAAALSQYGELLLEANRSINLTAARDATAVAEQILDSLTLRADIDGPFIDLGSGNGFPGIPLALATGQPVVLVESIKKKARILAGLLTALRINGDVCEMRAESLARDPAFREHFRYATARAVASAPTVAELAVPFLSIGGRALLQRGLVTDREYAAVEDAAPMLGAVVRERRPLEGNRCVIVLEKVSPTQARFPRREGIPQKRPLCYDGPTALQVGG